MAQNDLDEIALAEEFSIGIFKGNEEFNYELISDLRKVDKNIEYPKLDTSYIDF